MITDFSFLSLKTIENPTNQKVVSVLRNGSGVFECARECATRALGHRRMHGTLWDSLVSVAIRLCFMFAYCFVSFHCSVALVVFAYVLF